jgi:hypothetical protein
VYHRDDRYDIRSVDRSSRGGERATRWRQSQGGVDRRALIRRSTTGRSPERGDLDDCGACLSLVVFWRRVPRVLARLDWSRPHQLALAVAIALTVVRFVPYGIAEAAPGADMSMHSYTARLILDADGLPSTYRPLLPVDE